MSAKKARSRPRRVASDPSKKGLEQVLAHAQEETRRQLTEAIKKKEKTGRRLMDILKSDVDREMFGRIFALLHKPAEPPAKGKKGETVKDMLVAGGWLTEEELNDLEQRRDVEDGRLLVQSGYITEEQFQEALAQQERSGQSFWRILVNRGLVAPKQIADVRKYGARRLRPTLDEEAVKHVVLRTGLVSEEQWAAAVKEHKRSGRDVLQTLLETTGIRKRVLGEALGKELGIPFVDLESVKPQPEALGLLPRHLALENRILPIALSDRTVELAMANPQNVAAREQFRMMVNMDVKPLFAFESDVVEGVRRYLGEAEAAEARGLSGFERLKARLRGAAAADDRMVSMAENVGVVNLVASIIEGAINSHATDIHLEPQADGLRVRYRIDGILYDVMNLPENLKAGVVSRVKVLAGMDITERRHPQDGHFTIDVLERNYDLRVATLPTVLGEKVVLRLLNPEDVFRGLRELGLEPEQLETVEDAIAQPYGMILATGPIGSGKTTTLYAALSQVDILTENVVTIEDPVEYQLPGINQVQVDLRIDRTFANMLRSVLRQDADVMMVGEIRDADTAQVAVRAAMTGHLVFSTLHTNDAVGAVDTLRHLGVLPFFINSALVAVIAQRLVRRVCPACREAYRPDREALRAVGLTPQSARGTTFYRAPGCEACFQTGYKGRTGIFEVFRLSDSIRECILEGAGHEAIEKRAREEGMIPLREAGLKKVRAGVTTLEELIRVISG